LMSTNNAPTGRIGHTAVWSGSDFIVFGGSNGTNDLNTGARYTAASDTWKSLSLSNAPPGLVDHAAVWTGNQMLIAGGESTNLYNQTVEIYNPVQDAWTYGVLPPDLSAPRSGLANICAVWTGSALLVWGGFNSTFGYNNQPFLYTPALNLDLLIRQ
jgi:N-acetylneuraminic acid mutarotase